MNSIVIPYKPRPLQASLHDSLKRFNVIVCHRRFGKTVFAINEMIKKCMMNQMERGRYAYLAPTYRQAKAIAWDYLKHYSRPIPGVSINEAEMRVDYPNGGRIQLFGCDNPDALRGVYLDGVILDEYAQMPSSLFGEVIRPALSDRQGFAVFIGTPKGKNAFYDLYQKAGEAKEWFTAIYRANETNIISPKELDSAKEIMSHEEYMQEYECSWTAAIRGSVYGQLMTAAESDRRIGFIPIEPILDVHTFWDLGISDSMAIWFVQATGSEIRCIHYYENNNKGMQHYIGYLEAFAREKSIKYGDHYAPHDIEVRELMSGESRRDTARAMGINFRVIKQHKIEDGIEAVRRILPRCWFDKNRCKLGIESLSQYRYEYDDKRGVFKKSPLHDWSSHAADAFRQMGVAWNDRLARPKIETGQTFNYSSEFSVF